MGVEKAGEPANTIMPVFEGVGELRVKETDRINSMVENLSKMGINIEIKYQNTINTEDYKPLKEFMKKFGKSEGIIVTKKEEGELKLDCGTIKLIPVCKWLLL